MTSGDHLSVQPDLPRPDFLQHLLAQREGLLAGILERGGIDFDALQQEEPRFEAEGSRTTFWPVGMTVGGVPLGFKLFDTPDHWESDGLVEEITTLRHVAAKLPQYASWLPRVHYELRNGGEPFGILTEDFTKGGDFRHNDSIGIPLGYFPDIFSRPGTVNWDHERGMVGIFYNGRTDETVQRIIDVHPIYNFSRVFEGDNFEYPEWFVQETGMDEVAAHIDDLRVEVSEIAKR